MLRAELAALRSRWRFLLVLCTVVLGSLLAAPAEAVTPQEAWVLQQVAAGREADLKKRFGDQDQARTLSARFLEDLLTGVYKVHRKGVMIRNAVIVESLDLERARIPHSVELVDCRFQKKVVCRDAVFENSLIMSGSHFSQGADFYGMRVDLDVAFVMAVFQGPMNFFAANIGRQLSATGAQFECTGGEANFSGLQVGQHAFFDIATFKKGPVVFRGANIHGYFTARGAKFENSGDEADFDALQVGQDAVFDNAIFKGPVDFTGAEIRGQLSAVGTRFENTEKKANFNGLRVGQHAIFDNVTFKGPVVFIAADIRGQLKAEEARFESTKHKANFDSLQVGQHANFRNAIFKGPVVFLNADIRGQFIATGAQFESTEHEADFDGLKAGLGVYFRNVTCRGEVYLTYGNYLDLDFWGAGETNQGAAASPVTLDLTGTRIQRKLSVTDLTLNSLAADYLRVKGPATFSRLHIKDKAAFQNAALETLEFQEVKLAKQASLKLDGLTYTALCVDGPDNFKGALDLVKRSTFNPQNYVQLEDYYKRRGHPDWADTVFITMKTKELDHRPWYARWLIKFFWGWPAGYGRKPLRLLVIGLVIILVGAALFNPRYLEKDKNPLKSFLPRDPEYALEDKKPAPGGKLRVLLLRFLISLDQFLPAVNLGLADYWKAKDTHFLIWAFFTVEQGLGWIFVSIGLAAIYTQLK